MRKTGAAVLATTLEIADLLVVRAEPVHTVVDTPYHLRARSEATNSAVPTAMLIRGT